LQIQQFGLQPFFRLGRRVFAGIVYTGFAAEIGGFHKNAVIIRLAQEYGSEISRFAKQDVHGGRFGVGGIRANMEGLLVRKCEAGQTFFRVSLGARLAFQPQ